MNLDREEQPYRPETPNEVLDPGYGSRMLFLSYKYSQGSFHLQRQIFRYLHKLRPEWRIENDAFKEQLYHAALYPLTKFVLPSLPSALSGRPNTNRVYHSPYDRDGLVFTPESLTKDIRHELDELEVILNDLIPAPIDRSFISEDMYIDDYYYKLRAEWERGLHLIPRERLVSHLTVGVIGRDFLFLKRNEGRPRGNTDLNTPAFDPWESHIISYAMRSKKTGLVEFDKMFQEIRDDISSSRADRIGDQTNSHKLPEIIRIYNQHHPTTPFMS